MNPILYYNIWKYHPGKHSYPCDKKEFENQCAIRMSLALHKSNVDLRSFHGVKCWQGHDDGFKHILRAQELADWISTKPNIFGNKKVFSKSKNPKLSHFDFWKLKGIVFIQDGWRSTDHIDIWNGAMMKGGEVEYLDLNSKEIWFWQLA